MLARHRDYMAAPKGISKKTKFVIAFLPGIECVLDTIIGGRWIRWGGVRSIPFSQQDSLAVCSEEIQPAQPTQTSTLKKHLYFGAGLD